MRTSLGQMDGDSWERYCQKLLRLRYNDYQEVPAQFGGDYGIEGFTRSGLVFQCYCPDEDPSGKNLYEKQRDKITKDVKKLIKNATKISSLGAGTIQEWHFIIPRYNSHNLLFHCRKKEAEVQSKNLSTIHSDFKIILKTEDDYIPEGQILLGMGDRQVQPMVEEPPSEKMEAFLTSDNKIVMNIKTKLRRLELASDQRKDLIREIVAGYIIGRDELEILNVKFPSTYRSVVKLKSATESQLKVRTLSCRDKHGTLLSEVLKEYEGKLHADFSESLSSALIARLSTEAISDWLGRCPLDFHESEDSNENS